MKKYLKSCLFVLVCTFCLSNNVFAVAWISDFSEASNISKNNNKPMLVLFSQEGCKWCDRLKEEILTQSDFINEVQTTFVFCNIYFPKNMRRVSQQMQTHINAKEKYQVQGFPTIVILDDKGAYRSKFGYQPISGKEYAQKLKKCCQ